MVRSMITAFQEAWTDCMNIDATLKGLINAGTHIFE